MKSKRSKTVSLVLITSLVALGACSQEKKKEQEVYLRADETAEYSKGHVNQSSGSTSSFIQGALMYHVFSNLGRGNGYASSSISSSSNIGRNTAKSTVYSKSSFSTTGKSAVSRGGFGSSSRSSAS